MHSCSKRANWPSMITVLVVGVSVSAQTLRQPAAAPSSQPVLDVETDRILTRLENREVHDLRANISWRQRYVRDPEDEAVIKQGELWYQDRDPVARFLIEFKSRIIGDKRRKLNERHMFDGCWYVEVQSRTKMITRRQIRRPDDPGDPYKVGAGVFPLPFGQKKEDILREFVVTHIPPAADDPPATDHLRLVPRTGTRSGDSYRELDFWINREGSSAGLPIKVRVAKVAGTGKVNSYITVTFDDVRLNQGFSSSVFEIKTPRGYEETIEELEPAAPPPGPQRRALSPQPYR